MSELRTTLAAAITEAASAPAVKTSAIGAGLTGIGDWLTTGTGMATAAGLTMTLASLLLQVWSVIRRDEREGREEARRLREHNSKMGPP